MTRPRQVAIALATLTLLAPQPLAAGAARPPARPAIGVPSAVLVDATDGHVLYRRAARSRRPIASATKLMTALLSLEGLSVRRRLRAAPYMATAGESRINLRPGERMEVGDLLRALLLESANDAAATLARGTAGSISHFVARMNARARELHLSDTRYANPVGLDERGNFSSAVDLSRLTRKLLRNDTFAAIVDMPSARLRTGARPRVVDNRNDLVARVPWIDGVKTGHTSKAGYVLVGYGRRKGIGLVSVVLGASSEAERDADTLSLLSYGFHLYRRVHALRPGAELARAKVKFFGDRTVELTTRRPVTVTIRRGQRLQIRVNAPHELEGPLERGARVGTVGVFKAGRLVRVMPLVTADPVPGAGFARKLAHRVLEPGVLVALVLAAMIAVAVGRGRRRGEKGGARSRRVLT